jgi:hypothetical protein
MTVQISTICVIRGCSNSAVYFMRRIKRDGTFQEGLMCHRCDARYGRENMAALGIMEQSDNEEVESSLTQ